MTNTYLAYCSGCDDNGDLAEVELVAHAADIKAAETLFVFKVQEYRATANIPDLTVDDIIEIPGDNTNSPVAMRKRFFKSEFDGSPVILFEYLFDAPEGVGRYQVDEEQDHPIMALFN